MTVKGDNNQKCIIHPIHEKENDPGGRWEWLWNGNGHGEVHEVGLKRIF